MLITLCVDTDCRDEDQILVQMNAVDLDHQQIEAGEIASPSTLSCAPLTADRHGAAHQRGGGASNT